MTSQRKFLKICTNAYHPSERRIYNSCSIISTNLNESLSSQSTDTTGFDPEDSENTPLGTMKILSIKTCDQDGCLIELLTTDSGVFTCSCSEKEYTYLYQLFVDKDLNHIYIYKIDLCDDKDTDMASSDWDVIYLKNCHGLKKNIKLVCKQFFKRQSEQALYAVPDFSTMAAASVKQAERNLSLDNICTQNTTHLLHQEEQTEIKSSPGNIFTQNTTHLLHQEEQTEIKSSLGNIFTQNTTHLLHQEEQTEIKSSLDNIFTQYTTHLLHKDEQTEIKSSLGNIFTQNTTHLLHQKMQTEIKSSLGNISDLQEVRKQLTDQKGQAKGETVNGYKTEKTSSFLHAHGEATTSSMFPEIFKEHPSIQLHLPTKVQLSVWKLRKAIAKTQQDLMMFDNLLTLKSSNYGNFDIESDILSLTEKRLNDLKDKLFLDSFSSSLKSFLKMLYESQKDFDGFDFLNGKSPADKNNEQKENKNLAEKKPKEDNEKANIKNVTDLHSTDDDTDVKTDEADQDIDLKDKTKDEKESTTKSENQKHREHGEGMRSTQKLKGAVAICVDKKEKGIPCVAEWVSNSKTPVLYVSNIELLRQLIQNEFSDGNQQDKKTKEFLMQFVTHGYGRFRQGRMSVRPLTHTEMMFLDMDIYLNRVSTFVDWPNKSISSLQLAKAGFIYEGEGEKVRCFSCGLTISDFPAEFVPLNFHHAENNNCNFLKSLESNNASEIDNKLLHDAASEGQRDGKTQPHIQNKFPQTDQDQSNDNVFDSILVTDKTQTRHNGLDSSSNLQPTRSHTDIDDRSVKDRPGNNSLNWTVDNNSNLSDNILGSAKHPQFIGIHNRLKSFICWSHGHIKEPRYFVDAGFYFTGKEDIVRCFSCDIGLAEWISEDDPWVEHARHSPSCLFVIKKRGREFVKNIQRKWRQIYCPKHTEFEELDNRIRSFSNWPSNVIQRPEQLASAGFYYTGRNDEVRCHYCTGGLKGWKEGDEPWTEHARWFPSCKFLIKLKGTAYIKEIARKYDSNHVTDSSSRTRGQEDQSIIENKNLAEEKLKEDNEKANMKNVTDLHSPHGDTDVKTDENNQDIELKDKTKDEKESTTKSESHKHREHGEGMSLFKKVRRGNNNLRVDVCLDKKGNEKTYDAASMGRKHDKTEHHTMNMKSRDERCHNDAQIPVDSVHIKGNTARRDNELKDRRNIQTNTNTHADIDHSSPEGSNSTSRLILLESDYTHGDIRDGNRPGNSSLNRTLDNDSNLSDHVLGSAKHPQFIGIHNRLKSFIGWSHRDIKEPRYFVEAGFYYTGKEDIVRCFFCDIGLAEWISDDDPWVEHARHSPSCLFLIEKRGREFVENIQRKWRQIYCPKRTEFEELDDRIRSFSNWPSNVIQRPEQLASAGFYYTGKNDEVRCHYCTGGLKGWEEGDEPWAEHARWFPSCKFLIKSKGSAYIEEIARKYNNNHVTDGSSRTRGQDDQSKFLTGTEPRNNTQSLVNGIDSKAKCVKQIENSRQTVNSVIDEIIGTEPRNNTQLPINGIGSEAARRVQQIEYSRGKVNRAIDELIRTANLPQELDKMDTESASIDSLQLAIKKLRAEICVCTRCKNAERCMIFVPCGHKLVCEPCSKNLKRCLHCNKRIKKCIKTYLS